MTTNEVRARIAAHRLDRGWTYEELTADLKHVVPVARVHAASVRRFLLGQQSPRETFEYQLRLYAQSLRPRVTGRQKGAA